MLKQGWTNSVKQAIYKLYDSENPNLTKVKDTPDSRHQGRSRSKLLRVLDNKEDSVSSAFPQGKQNEDLI